MTCFASHIDRIDHAIRAADATGRTVALLGRSMRRNVEIAERLGELRRRAAPTVAPRDARRRARPQLAGAVHGLAGRGVRRPGAGRARRASAPDRQPHGHDRLRHAGRCPATRRPSRSLQHDLESRGATIVTHHDAPIHVSGHASADEVAELIELLRPRFLVPVHGELPMQEAQARIAVARVRPRPRRRPHHGRNGDVLELDRDQAEVVDHVLEPRGRWPTPTALPLPIPDVAVPRDTLLAWLDVR